MNGQIKTILLIVAAILFLFVGVLVAGGMYVSSVYNGLVTAHEQVPAAWSQVENVLQRRNDLIPNLVATVKGYAKHEKDTFGQVTQALQSFGRATTVNQKIELDQTITGLLSRIMSVALQYPTLKADVSFLRLQDELAGTENRIAVERMRYNETVMAYNMQVKRFPTNLIARYVGFTENPEYFKADPAARVAPQVKF